MAYLYLTTYDLRNVIDLDMLDCLSFIIAAACHDVGHDGYTNSFHQKVITSRAIDSNFLHFDLH